jgi:UDP-glucuronate 4-epimerase
LFAPHDVTDAILAGRPIRLFNNGEMRRDFTCIDDILSAIAAAAGPSRAEPGRHRLSNLGNHRPETLLDFIAALEQALGRKAIREPAPMQPGDVTTTDAEIETARHDLGFDPKTPIAEGLKRLVSWYRGFHGTTP